MIGPFLRQISFRLSGLWRRRRRKSTFTCLGPRQLEGSCTGHGGLLGRTPAHSKQNPFQRHSSSVSPCQQGKVLNSSTCVIARDPDKINKVELENEDPRNMIQDPPNIEAVRFYHEPESSEASHAEVTATIEGARWHAHHMRSNTSAYDSAQSTLSLTRWEFIRVMEYSRQWLCICGCIYEYVYIGLRYYPSL